MNRQADHSIKGFLYQFLMTIKLILTSRTNEVIVCEGIEDIDVVSGNFVNAMQFKYHESNEKFTLSSVYKPILLMMHHFFKNPSLSINYILYAYFPNEKEGLKQLTLEDCNKILKSKNRDFKPLLAEINGKINPQNFLDRFTFQIGIQFDELVDEVKSLIEKEGFSKEETDNLIFPNLIHMVSDLSIKKTIAERTTTKENVLEVIKQQKKLLLNNWMLELREFDNIIKHKRRMMSENLNNRMRRRAFIFNKEMSQNTTYIIDFIKDLIMKYYSSQLCIHEPLFCFDLEEDKFNEIRVELATNELFGWDGYIGNKFIPARFLQSPPITKINNKVTKRDFQFKILNRKNISTLNPLLYDDFYLFTDDFTEIQINRAKKELITLTGFNYFYYIFQLRKGYNYDN